MAQILRETVGNIDRGVRQAAQRNTGFDARLRLVQTVGEPQRVRRAQLDFAFQTRERQRRVANRASYPDVVAGLRAVPPQRQTCWDLPADGDADVERTLGRVAAD